MDRLHEVDVLIVEDEATALEGLLELLRLEGLRTAGARNGAEAIGLLEGGLTPSLVLLDLTMPVMDGWEFCRTLEEKDGLRDARELPIAVFTGVAIETVGQLPDRRCDAGFIEKPVRVGALLAVVRRYCGARS